VVPFQTSSGCVLDLSIHPLMIHSSGSFILGLPPNIMMFGTNRAIPIHLPWDVIVESYQEGWLLSAGIVLILAFVAF